MISHLNLITEIHVWLRRLIINDPLRKARSIGVAALREVHPVAHHHFRKLSIRLGQQRILAIEIAKHVSNLTRVVGPEILASRIRRHVTEAIQISFSLSVRGHTRPRAHVQREQTVTQSMRSWARMTANGKAK